MNELTKDLGADGKHIVTRLVNEIDKLRESFQQLLTDSTAELRTLVLSKTEEVASLQAQKRDLQHKVDVLQEKLDDAESYSRRDCVILSGRCIPAETPSEDTAKVAMELLKNKLNVDLPLSEINMVHRIGKQNVASGINRKCIIKLVLRLKKYDLRKACKTQDKRDTNKIFVSESLTPTRGKLFFILRKIHADHKTIVKGCTTQDGSVVAYTKPVGGNGRDVRHVLIHMKS